MNGYRSVRVAGILCGAILAAFLCGALLLLGTGFDPVRSFHRMVQAAFGSQFAVVQTFQQTVPILLCALGIAFAAKLKLWNIGAEGQFYMGALATAGVFQYFPDLPGPVMIPLMAIVGMLAGALWILIPALLRTYFGVSEILTTLMFNYIALPIVNYFLYGPWKSPTAFNFPVTNRMTSNAFLPVMPGFSVHMGFIAALLIALLLHTYIARTAPGFRLRATGDNRKAAIYAGYSVKRVEIGALCLAGALAGLAGMIQVTGVTHQMLPNISSGYGFAGIIVASLALTSIAGCVGLALLFAALLVGAKGIETIGVPSGIANFLSGLVLLFLLVGIALSGRRGRLLRWPVRVKAEGGDPGG